MSAALARPNGAPEPEGSKDAAALRALAEAAARTLSDVLPAPEAPPEGAERRGPFRPERLLTARARRQAAQAVRFFRAADGAALVLVTLAAAVATLGGNLAAEPVRALLPFAAGGLAAWSLTERLGLYRFKAVESLSAHLGRLAFAFAAAGAVGAACAWAAGTDPRTAAAAGLGVLAAYAVLNLMHLGWWSTVERWRASGRLAGNIVVVGATKHAERLIRAALDRRDVRVLGVFDDRLARAPRDVAGVPVLGDTEALLHHRMLPSVDRIVVALDPAARGRVGEVVRRLSGLPNEVALYVDLDDDQSRSDAVSRLADAPLSFGAAPEEESRAFAKRVQDLAIGTLALALLAPAMLVIGLVIRLDSPGPALFRQRRHGFNNEEIVVWKFRTMRADAADARAERQVTADDDRVTRVGRFLRKTSLDELPQLFNVLKGEMSLVGPRPHAVGMKTGRAESARLVAEYAWRHRIKPGMTGWAAVKGSRGPLHTAEDVRRRVALDIEYVQRQSFWLDLWIMAVTVPVLLGDRKAVR